MKTIQPSLESTRCLVQITESQNPSWYEDHPERGNVGDVDVCYTQAPPEANGSPFLEEEDRPLSVIGEVLGKVLWLKRSEEAPKEIEEVIQRYKDLQRGMPVL
ncbi:MAG: hypothetical protein PVG49_14660 [Desulfobacteraceae bacterium]